MSGGQNSGHGHVFPRADGVKARCGGPAICTECARDLGLKLSGANPDDLADEFARAKREHEQLLLSDPFVQELVRALFKVVETPCMSDDHRQAMNAAAGLLSRCGVKR
jgi:hypothetical protein